MAQPEKLRKAVVEILLESELPRTLVAKDSGLGRATLEAWLSGLRNPSAESVAQIVSGFEQRAERLHKLSVRLRNVLAEEG